MTAAGQDVVVVLERFGPGDLIGLSEDQILRREPPTGSVGFQPSLFPFIEFRAADLPWRLTPTEPDGHGRLRPWLALVVVPVEGESPLAQAAGAPLLEIQLSADQLPQIDEVDLWAHVQLPADPQATPAQVLASSPERALARVMSPKALDPRTQYLACVVPTFEAGRLAGVGQPVADARSAAPAWGSGSVTLPVLDSWTFSTTDAGDFETLARRLKPRDLAEASRPWPIDVFHISGDVGGRVVPFETALVPAGWSDSWDGAARVTAANRVRSWVERVEDASTEVPAVGPPLYGDMAAATGLGRRGGAAS